MAAVYNLEPQPTGKCVLHTTSGDILLELFAQQTPLTCRNFLQLCLDGYYDNTIFHRLIPGWIIQGGDPTGTGSGGSSSYDAPFADEFHSRLKFNRRGLLGMANTGTKDDNASQFFITLGKADELTNKNTMFGRVEGDTIFNLVKMGEADLTEEEGSERPMYPTRITGTDVLVNPFEGMQRRTTAVGNGQSNRQQDKKKVVKKKLAKGLLSFAGDDGDEDEVAPILKPKFNTKAVAETTMPKSVKRSATEEDNDRPRKRRATSSPSSSPPPTRSVSKRQVPTRQPNVLQPPSPSVSPEPESKPANVSALERADAQIAALKTSLKRNVTMAVANQSKKLSTLEAMIPSTSTKGRRRKGAPSGSALGGTVSRAEQKALDQFNAFRKRLEVAGTAAPNRSAREQLDVDLQMKEKNASVEDDSEEAALCDLHFVPHCKSCEKWDEEDADEAAESGDDDNGWLTHQLTFEKDRLGKDLEWKRQNEKELVVIDPRERAKEIRDEAKKGKDRSKAR